MVNFQNVFRASPTNYMILEADAPKFTIVEVTDFHTELLNRGRDTLIGSGLFECYPENPDNNWDQNSTQKLRTSLSEVVIKRTAQTLNVRYDVFNKSYGIFEPRYWSILNIPIIEEGFVKYILNTTIDITPFYKNGFSIK